MWQNVSSHCLEGLLSLEEKVFSEETCEKIVLKLHTENLEGENEGECIVGSGMDNKNEDMEAE